MVPQVLTLLFGCIPKDRRYVFAFEFDMVLSIFLFKKGFALARWT